MLEREAFLHGVGDAVADDGDHVAVIADCGAVANAAVAGDDVCAAFFVGAGNHEVEQAIERVDFAVDRTAFREIDHGVAIGSEDVAGADDVGAAEEDQAVAVGVRGVRVLEDDGFVVEERPFVGVIGVGGPEFLRRGSVLAAVGGGHAVENGDLGDDRGARGFRRPFRK